MGKQHRIFSKRIFVAACVGALLLGRLNVLAVLFKSTGDPSYNTSTPTGSLTNSGWQYEGHWGCYLGTPIAPCYFVAAKHVGGSIGQTFMLNGFTYHTTAMVSNPSADLIVWKVAETFPIYALLYTNSNEVGRHCVVFGRGTQRGAPVILDKTNGWRWGSSDGVERWGENDISTNMNGGAGIGQLLYATFDRGAGSNECDLSVGDSSGGLFIQEDGEWELAGIHYAVDGYFSANGTTNTQFDTAVMDAGGLYVGSGTNWEFFTNTAADIPTGFYSTRISANLGWINSVIDFLPGDDLQFTAIQPSGNDVDISFATESNRLYYVEYTDDLSSGSWTIFTNNVPGTGGIVSVVDPNAAGLTNRFYQLGLVP
ncbi:MAG TPA: hypothetical protein VL171_17025 [Verrucomicrobiae bacterium]|nr:hypothetical protein [Verrucomicrobiae bacterium]